jgi:hypothetical protein
MFQVIAVLALALLAFPGLAQTKYSKDWMWNTDDTSGYYAATANESGRILGQYCYLSDNTCIYTVSFGITCEEGDKHPVLVNSNTGVLSVDIICGHKMSANENAFYITPFDAIDNTVRNASTIGFALAMESGRFKVVRFSLAGSTYAIESMLDEVAKRFSQDGGGARDGYTNSTTDQYL